MHEAVINGNIIFFHMVPPNVHVTVQSYGLTKTLLSIKFQKISCLAESLFSTLGLRFHATKTKTRP